MGCQGPTHALEVPPLRLSEGVRNLGDHALFGGDLTHARLPAPVTTTRSRLRAADSARHARAFADVVTSGAAPWRPFGRTSSYDSSQPGCRLLAVPTATAPPPPLAATQTLSR